MSNSYNFTGNVHQAIPDLKPADFSSVFSASVASGDFIKQVTTSNGQTLTAISADPLTENKQSVVMMSGVQPVSIPHYFEIEATLSQRVRGPHAFIEAVDRGTAAPAVQSWSIASITQATTTLTVVFNTAPAIVLGDFLSISGVSDNRLNYHNLVVATISQDGLTITATVSDDATLPSVSVGPLTSQGVATLVPHSYGANNYWGIRLTGAATTSAAHITRFGGSPEMLSGTFTGSQLVTVASSAPVWTSAATGAYSVKATSRYSVRCDARQVAFADVATDTASIQTIRTIRSGVKPSLLGDYVVRYRVVSPISMTRPIAKITTISKSGTTTATVNTDVAHGLVTGQYVTIKGVRDQTNFASITTPVAVTVVSPTQFQLVLGSAVTASSTGGAVILSNGGYDQPGIIGQAVQSVARDANNYVTCVGSASWSGVQVGEYYNLYGVRDAAGADLGFDGVYEAVTVNTTTLVLKPVTESISGSVLAPVGTVVTTTNSSGALILRQTLRVHDIVLESYDHNRVIIDGQGASDLTKALPVVLASSPSVNQGTASVISSTSGLGGWYTHPAIIGITDIASAAITATSTSSAISNNLGSAFQVAIPVTAVSGTTPTMDVRIEESHDGGTNYVTLYEFQRITAIGYYVSPMLRCNGRTIRFVRTIAGTTPSFTHSVVRNLWPSTPADKISRLFDRSISLTTLNATTSSLLAGSASNAQLVLSLGAATTPPVMKLQGSDDNVNWYDLSASTLTGVASSTVQLSVPSINALYIRGVVSTAGATVTPGYVMIKAWG